MCVDAYRPRLSLVESLQAQFEVLDALGRLRLLVREVDGPLVYTTSFGIEAQAITHLIVTHDLPIELVTLDTGRLFPETHALWSETEARYGRRIRPVYPRHDALEALIAQQGINGFYDSVSARMACCAIRKVEPLTRALAGAAAWVTGLRASQSEHRRDLSLVSWEETHGLIKANPLLDWSREEVVAFVEREGVPISPLHARGFPSIGCAPCTRAVPPGSPERAGRWWWEEEAKECGLHLGPDGRLSPVAATEGAGS